MKWISVKDRLPVVPKGDRIFKSEVLCCVPLGNGEFWIDVFSFYRRGHFSTGRVGEIKNVTHWMPLPDPPEEKP